MSNSVDRLASALSDRYTIERELGQGGMATVYLAEDLKHKRKVAVKVLRPELAAILGAERFLKEIEVTANLQHPHILPLFDSGEADAFLYYVMPYIEGESLRDKLNREKQLGVDETIEIAKSVAAALQYAHEREIVHRDIKPENILLQSGQALVADFGIALAVSQAGSTRLTETGLSLGTPHYMSPEQATGDRELDARSDVYSLGAVVYEMLAGEPPHLGNTVQAVIARILTGVPEALTARRPSIPVHVAASVEHALEKLPADRFATAAKFAEALSNPAFTLPTVGVQRKAASVGDWRTRLAIPFAVLALMFALAFAWALRRPPPSLPVEKFAVRLPAGEETDVLGSPIALSADGSVMVYRGPSESPLGQLWFRRRNELHATPIQGSDAGGVPAISPDGGKVAWLRATSVTGGPLMMASLQGGAPRTVVDSVSRLGFDWDRNGALYFARAEGISRVLVGGAEEVVTVVDRPAGEVAHGWIHVLPSAKGAVFTIFGVSGRTLRAVRFETGEITELTAGTFARYSPTGHLVWATEDGTLMAAPFDPDELALTGPAVSVLDDVRVTASGAAHFALSETGTLIYRTGGGSRLAEPVWVDRSGAVQEIEPGWRIDPALGTAGLALSPDGTRLAVSIRGGAVDVWVKQLDAGPLARLTFEGDVNFRPFWLPDRRSIGFMSNRNGQIALWRKRADGSGAAELLWEHDQSIQEGFITRDGNWLLYRLGSAAGNRDIYAMRLDADSVETALATAEFGERAAVVSPDGQWFAYVSDESGRDEVYVRPFPNAGDGRWQVSTAGGLEPMWAHNGRELFYRNSADELVLVEVTTEPTFGVDQQRVLFSAAEYLSDFNHVLYDLTPDDQRFVMLRGIEADSGELIWVQNWFEELKATVGN